MKRNLSTTVKCDIFKKDITFPVCKGNDNVCGTCQYTHTGTFIRTKLGINVC